MCVVTAAALRRVLILEDDEDHAALVSSAFARHRDGYEVSVASSLQEARAQQAAWCPDLIIADMRLPDGRGIELLPSSSSGPPFPLIVMTSFGDEKVAVEAIKSGAMDYVVKSAESLAALPQLATRVLREWGHIEEQRRAERALEESEERFRSLTESAPDAIVSVDQTGRLVSWNKGARQIFGYTEEEIIGRPVVLLVPERDRARHVAELAGTPTEQPMLGRTTRIVGLTKDQREVPIELSMFGWATKRGRFFGGIVRDVSDRDKAEAQLRAAQKMEAIGRLAGAVAHDFNNILTAIEAYCELLFEAIPPESPVLEDVAQIQLAGRRAAGLTRQLLAFSRRQVQVLRVLDLNEVIQGVRDMLLRLIGEDIELRIELDPSLGSISADVGQMEQIIINLALNGRDAMPRGGQLVIATANVELDEETAARYPGAQPGAKVMLEVRDSGEGMDSATQAQIFEPFFTTKDEGRGTGLGLATVYGIVHQSGGSVHVESEVGRGSVFKVYLPRVDDLADHLAAAVETAAGACGSETVLLVEDQEAVREAARRILESAGYCVLTADSGEEALRVAEETNGRIDLLLSDVVMPGTSGPTVAARLSSRRKDLRVVFMSGYSDEMLARRRVAGPGAPLLEKPFTAARLLQVVRQALDAPLPQPHPVQGD